MHALCAPPLAPYVYSSFTCTIRCVLLLPGPSLSVRVHVRLLCCPVGPSLLQFTHVTRFLGKKVVLLGLYNGQKLQHEPEQDVVMYTRALDEGMPGATFVRVLLLRGKMQGAVLIGETDLEETFENLILDGLDLSQFGPGLLDPDIELDHVFD